jgi:hypothetical protein
MIPCKVWRVCVAAAWNIKNWMLSLRCLLRSRFLHTEYSPLQDSDRNHPSCGPVVRYLVLKALFRSSSTVIDDLSSVGPGLFHCIREFFPLAAPENILDTCMIQSFIFRKFCIKACCVPDQQQLRFPLMQDYSRPFSPFIPLGCAFLTAIIIPKPLQLPQVLNLHQHLQQLFAAFLNSSMLCPREFPIHEACCTCIFLFQSGLQSDLQQVSLLVGLYLVLDRGTLSEPWVASSDRAFFTCVS